MTIFSVGVWRVRYVVDTDCVRDTVLVYDYGNSAHIQEMVRSGCSSLMFVVCATHQGVCGRFQCCREILFVEEDIANNLE